MIKRSFGTPPDRQEEVTDMTVESDAKPIEVLLVEDDPADVGATEETLKGASRTSITVAEDGETALARLRREEEHESSSRPDLIFLDLKLPGMDGRYCNKSPETLTS